VQIGGLEIPSDSPVFPAILAIHVSAGVLAAATGAVAMLMEKRRGGHTRTGSIYFWSVATLFATSTALATMRWTDDYHLFPLGPWHSRRRYSVERRGGDDGNANRYAHRWHGRFVQCGARGLLC